jgi:hypothetical protein
MPLVLFARIRSMGLGYDWYAAILPGIRGATIKKEECMKEPSPLPGGGFFIGPGVKKLHGLQHLQVGYVNNDYISVPANSFGRLCIFLKTNRL